MTGTAHSDCVTSPSGTPGVQTKMCFGTETQEIGFQMLLVEGVTLVETAAQEAGLGGSKHGLLTAASARGTWFLSCNNETPLGTEKGLNTAPSPCAASQSSRL